MVTLFCHIVDLTLLVTLFGHIIGDIVGYKINIRNVSQVLRIDTASGAIITEHRPHQNTAVQLLVCDNYVVTAVGKM